ncbi:MAG: hypothetical protein ACP5D9_00590 [Mariniphaga sp.]
MKTKYRILLAILFPAILFSCSEQDKFLDLSDAAIWISSSVKEPVRESAGDILVEEIGKRISFQLKTGLNEDSKTLIALVLVSDKELNGLVVPQREGDFPEKKKEGFRLVHDKNGKQHIIWIIGADARGVLYGTGKLLRTAGMRRGSIKIPAGLDVASSPEYPIRGHQFGYRNTANSWDAWTVEQFDRHFREQMLFGANSFENIPFGEQSFHMKIPREEMNIELSRICNKYDADYWVWTPASFDLKDSKKRQEALEKHEAFYKACPRLDGVFFPGGDPGHNHPKEVMPFLKELSVILHRYHPTAGIWVSLQGFNQEKVVYFFDYLNEKSPDWLTGVVYGPGSPPIDLEKKMLPEKYKHRFYPDITHSVRCQYPVPGWDQAFALTLGRECTNPMPNYYTKIFLRDSPFTDGFVSYSDGVHDDVNKVLWSRLGWNSKADIRNIVVEYCRFYFGPDVAEKAADGIFALEQNWVGPVAENETIGKTLSLWKTLETENPELKDNWRWQQLVMRAYYDTYIQKRQAYEKRLEEEAYDILANAKTTGSEKAMSDAITHLKKAVNEPVARELKEKVVRYCDDLFQSIGLQTSVPKYRASGYERGCVLDFIDHPLNNRWWLEDEFEKVRKMPTEKEKLSRLEFIRTYEKPGEGSFYDNISSADARHVISKTDDAIDYLWENDGKSRKRLSTQLFQFTPVLKYDELDPDADYLIRVAGYGEALLRADGKRLEPTRYEKGYEQFKEFPLPGELIKDGKLKITFDKPDEEHLNWRQQSRVTDVWILKQ